MAYGKLTYNQNMPCRYLCFEEISKYLTGGHLYCLIFFNGCTDTKLAHKWAAMINFWGYPLNNCVPDLQDQRVLRIVRD